MASAFPGFGSARTERTNYDTLWVLPTNRYDHIVNNPTTQIAQNHVNKNMIPPVWTKVSRTPWEKPAQLCSGYGRKMQVCQLISSFDVSNALVLEYFNINGSSHFLSESWSNDWKILCQQTWSKARGYQSTERSVQEDRVCTCFAWRYESIGSYREATENSWTSNSISTLR